MQETYRVEDEINKDRKKHSQIGHIGERFLMNLKNVPIEKPYALLYGHWCLGYLTDEDLYSFLKNCRVKLLE